MVLTDDQEETDRYWNAIVDNGGEESACGWCKDSWGFSWQITPRVLLELTSEPRRAAAKRAFDAMMTMRRSTSPRSRPRARARRPMRKLTGAVFLSLDGVMQAPGGPSEDPTGGFRFGGWSSTVWRRGHRRADSASCIGADYDLLLGKRTYDIFAAYWPVRTRTKWPIARSVQAHATNMS